MTLLGIYCREMKTSVHIKFYTPVFRVAFPLQLITENYPMSFSGERLIKWWSIHHTERYSAKKEQQQVRLTSGRLLWVKEDNLKRFHNQYSSTCETTEITKLWRQRTGEWMPEFGVGSREGGAVRRSTRELGVTGWLCAVTALVVTGSCKHTSAWVSGSIWISSVHGSHVITRICYRPSYPRRSVGKKGQRGAKDFAPFLCNCQWIYIYSKIRSLWVFFK